MIAAINGAVAGMAVPISLCCDLRFMAEDAPMLVAFPQRGLIGEWGLSWLLPRVAGAGDALDMMLSSRKVSGAEAARIGRRQRRDAGRPGARAQPAVRPRPRRALLADVAGDHQAAGATASSTSASGPPSGSRSA